MANGNTPNLDITRLTEGQSGAVTLVNEALNRIDVTNHLSVISRTTTAEPGSPTDGDVYLLPSSGVTGTNWVNNDGDVAVYFGGWTFFTPTDGLILSVEDDNEMLVREAGVYLHLRKHLFHVRRANPTGSVDQSFGFTDRPLEVLEMRCVLVGSGSPSVTWTVRHGSDRSATGNEVVTSGTTTTSTTTGSDVTSFNDSSIAADSFLWLETTAASGTVTEMLVTVVTREA